MADEKKKRGRPKTPRTEEELQQLQGKRREWYKTYKKTYDQVTGYASQKKYKANHPERVREQKRRQGAKLYEPKLRIPIEKKPELEKLLSNTGLTISQLFLGAVEEKYGISLQKTVDKTEKK